MATEEKKSNEATTTATKEKQKQPRYMKVYTDKEMLKDVAACLKDDGTIDLKEIAPLTLKACKSVNPEYTLEKAKNYIVSRIRRLNGMAVWPYEIPVPVSVSAGEDYEEIASDFYETLSPAQKKAMDKKRKKT